MPEVRHEHPWKCHPPFIFHFLIHCFKTWKSPFHFTFANTNPMWVVNKLHPEKNVLSWHFLKKKSVFLPSTIFSISSCNVKRVDLMTSLCAITICWTKNLESCTWFILSLLWFLFLSSWQQSNQTLHSAKQTCRTSLPWLENCPSHKIPKLI